MTTPAPDQPAPPTSAGVHVPPPLPFALALGGAVLLDRGTPLALLPPDLRPLGLLLGWGLSSLALLGGAWALLSFRRARTAVLPNRPASTLVARGPYRRSRNPMYVALLTLYVGVSLVTNLGWAPVLGILPLLLLGLWIVPAEERYLAARFGAPYDEYRARVRRWL